MTRYDLVELNNPCEGVMQESLNGMYVRWEDAKADREQLIRECDRYRGALQDISKGEGPFSRDPLTHASNTIEAMKTIARTVLATNME